MEQHAIADLASLGTMLPQVSLSPAPIGSGAIFSIRGIGSTAGDNGIEQEVAINIDGVPVSRGRIVRQALFDVERVQALKGPQALYFGKNSPAGVIAIDSVNPGDRFEGYARVGYETEAREYFAQGAVDVPFSSVLSGRLAARSSRMDGSYLNNTAGAVSLPAGPGPLAFLLPAVNVPGAANAKLPGNRDDAARLTLALKPSNSFEANFKFFYGDHHDQGDNSSVITSSCAPGQTKPLVNRFPAGALFIVDPYGSCGLTRNTALGSLPVARAANYPLSNGGQPFSHTTSYLSSLTLNWRPSDDITLTSVTGYYEQRVRDFADFDGSSYAFATGANNEDFESWNEELRLATAYSGPLNFSGGVFVESNKRTFTQSGALGDFLPDPITGNTSQFGSLDKYKGDTSSVFGEVNWKITPTIELAAGLRYTGEKKTADEGMTYLHLLLTGFALPPTQRLTGGIREHNVSPQATLSWHITPDAMLYGAYKKGYKSGGFSTPALIPANATLANQSFAQETADGGEIGFKFSKPEYGLTGDLTAYHYVYHGLQLNSFDAATTSYFVHNAGSAKTDGIELNLNYKATQALTLHTAIGYNKARYGNFANATCWTGQAPTEGCTGAIATGNALLPFTNGTQNLSGKLLFRAPQWSSTSGAAYDGVMKSGLRFGLTADVRYSASYFTSETDSPFAHQNAYTTFDAGARLYRNDDWELALIGKNLSDKLYITLGGDMPLGPKGQTFGVLGATRQVVLQFTKHF
ncbi:MAG: TonB-dependent receptor [Pseudomonadota bacterium]|nr:TonB-dependent receptor [Pseudomonadota bacterium]